MTSIVPSINVSTPRHNSRQHSTDLQAALRNWRAMVESWLSDPGDEGAAWQCLLSAAAESSYMGFPRTAKLCRAIHAAMLKHPRERSLLRLDQQSALLSAWESLALLVAEPHNHTIMIAAPCQLLRLAYDLSESELDTPLSELSMTAAETHNSSALPQHRDLDVYLSARLDSLDRCLEEETWIVSQLAGLAEDLASGSQDQRPAQRLMRVLRSHKFFHQVDRVCLAGRVPNANQLMIVDASISDRCQPNALKPGYSCFVNPEGSLFKLRPGTLRIFDDSDRVLSAFSQAGRPAQRSIAMIDDMGLRSGLCLAIGRESELQGFLFLNSCQPDLFHNITIAFAPLISLLGLVATITLDSSGFHRRCGKIGQLDDDLPCTSRLFHAGEFRAYLYNALQRRSGPSMRCEIELTTTSGLDDFLYLPAQVAGNLAELIFRLQLVKPESPGLELAVAQRDSRVEISVPHLQKQTDLKQWEWMRWQIDYLNHFIANTPLQLSVSDERVGLSWPFEPILHSHRSIGYSVVY